MDRLPKPYVARFAIFDDDRAPIQLSDGSVSNGHWALKSKFIPANLQKCLDKYDLLTNNYQIDDLILKQSEPAELSKVFTDETGLITAILEGRNKINSVYLNAHYYSYLIRWGFTVEITDDLIPQVIKKDDQIAGAIMPVSKGNGNDQNR